MNEDQWANREPSKSSMWIDRWIDHTDQISPEHVTLQQGKSH